MADRPSNNDWPTRPYACPLMRRGIAASIGIAALAAAACGGSDSPETRAQRAERETRVEDRRQQREERRGGDDATESDPAAPSDTDGSDPEGPRRDRPQRERTGEGSGEEPEEEQGERGTWYGTEESDRCAADGAVDSTTAGERRRITLSEWTVTIGRATVAAGKVSLRVSNEGTQPHELLVIKGFTSETLPMAGQRIDEDALPAGAVVARAAPIEPGTRCELPVELSAGDHVLVCNLGDADEGHAGKGMRTDLQVG